MAVLSVGQLGQKNRKNISFLKKNLQMLKIKSHSSLKCPGSAKVNFLNLLTKIQLKAKHALGYLLTSTSWTYARTCWFIVSWFCDDLFLKIDYVIFLWQFYLVSFSKILLDLAQRTKNFAFLVIYGNQSLEYNNIFVINGRCPVVSKSSGQC